MSAEKALQDSKRPVNREPQNLAEALEFLQRDAVARGLDKLTDEEIEALIAAARRDVRDNESQH